jgi:hemin uptake protein HemP
MVNYIDLRYSSTDSHRLLRESIVNTSSQLLVQWQNTGPGISHDGNMYTTEMGQFYKLILSLVLCFGEPVYKHVTEDI